MSLDEVAKECKEAASSEQKAVARSPFFVSFTLTDLASLLILNYAICQ